MHLIISMHYSFRNDNLLFNLQIECFDESEANKAFQEVIIVQKITHSCL